MATGKRIRTDTVPDFDALPEWIQEKYARDLFEILEEEGKCSSKQQALSQ